MTFSHYAAGGTIHCEVAHFDGEGVVQAIGGDGAGGAGGGGGGGRIAIYHSGTNHWTGEYHVHGGLSHEFHGGSGECGVQKVAYHFQQETWIKVYVYNV